MRESLSGGSGLSEDEVNLLRGLLVRRRTRDAEKWLVRRGFSTNRASRIVLEQEMAVANAIYATPFWDVVFAITPLLIGLLLLGMALDTAPEPHMDKRGWLYEGPQRTLIVGAMVAPFFLAAAFFAFRAVRATMQYLKARMQYPIGRIQDSGV